MLQAMSSAARTISARVPAIDHPRCGATGVQDDGEEEEALRNLEEALARGHIREVGDPHLIGSDGDKRSLQQVRRDRTRGIRTRGNALGRDKTPTVTACYSRQTIRRAARLREHRSPFAHNSA